MKRTKAVLAVRGVNCMACHGVLGSSIVTDFGYGSPNFQTKSNFFNGANRSAFNDVDSGWQSMTVSGGSVFVPKAQISADDSLSLFGVNKQMSFKDLLGPGGAGASMISGVKPAAGQAQVVELSTVRISYPSESEIVDLAPRSLQGVGIGAAGISVTQPLSGLAADSSGRFVRNSDKGVNCYGDVVVLGTLFLKDAQIRTDSAGCRLYVSQSVFIQGPITYSGGGNAHLQITSPRAIVLGISATRLGANSSNSSAVRTSAANLSGPGGPWPRLAIGMELQYNPGGAPINGYASSAFFDNIVKDALSIGSELLDAGDPGATSNLAPGESLVTESGDHPGKRVAIDYSHLLLNAPHIHSRYGGTFRGVMIADVAMMARNPSSTESLSQFAYDPLFDNLESVFPALKTQILDIQ